MHTIADTKMLVEEGVISQAAARIIEARARNTMVALAINTVLCAGIVFATFGLIFWLANAFAVAICGILMAGAGLLTLRFGRPLYAMFGNAAALIGCGMLLGGMAFELSDKLPEMAGWILAAVGGVVAVGAGFSFLRGQLTTPFVTGAVMLMGGALHLFGLGFLLKDLALQGAPIVAFWLYSAAVLAGLGALTDIRLISALAIAPFAQALDTGTFYFHAAYVFYSPEATLSILQMAGLAAGMLWLAHNSTERTARHARIHVMMAFIVANLCALVGSLWGDVVGQTIWGPGVRYWRNGMSYDEWRAAMDAFEASALVIHEHVYSVLWALALAATAFVAAHRNQRGLFNAAITFAGIHGYTQMFETFYDEPLAYVIGGLAAVPLAWGMWRLNTWFLAQRQTLA